MSSGVVYRASVPIPLEFVVKATSRAKPAVLAKRERVVAGLVDFHTRNLPRGESAFVGVNIAVPLGESQQGTAIWRPMGEVVKRALHKSGVVDSGDWTDNDVVVSRGSSGLKHVCLVEVVVSLGAVGEFTPRFDIAAEDNRPATAASLKALAQACRKQRLSGDVLGGGESLSLAVAVPTDCLLSMNQRLDRFKATSRKRSLAELMTWQCMGVPAVVECVSISTKIAFPTTGHQRDAENWGPTRKALIDAIVRSGVLEDDNAEFVRDGGLDISAEPSGMPGVALVTLTLTPLSARPQSVLVVSNDVECGVVPAAPALVVSEVSGAVGGTQGYDMVSYAIRPGVGRDSAVGLEIRECESMVRSGGVLIVTWTDREDGSALCAEYVSSPRVHDFVGGATFIRTLS